MIGYKLTDENDRTHGGCQWGPGVTQEAPGEGELCTKGWIHLYDDPLLAVLHNPIHGEFNLATAHLWKCEAVGKIKRDGQMKFGAARVTTLRRIDLPVVTMEQQVRYGILVAMGVCHEKKWMVWAQNWLSGRDRSAKAAGDAWKIAREAASADRVADNEDAGWVALAATSAADSAATAAYWAALSAAWAALAAVRSAAGKELDLVVIARKAVTGTSSPRPRRSTSSGRMLGRVAMSRTSTSFGWMGSR